MRGLGDELKETVQGMLKRYEPDVTEKANAALAKAIRDGKTKLSPATMLKLNLTGKPKK